MKDPEAPLPQLAPDGKVDHTSHICKQGQTFDMTDSDRCKVADGLHSPLLCKTQQVLVHNLFSWTRHKGTGWCEGGLTMRSTKGFLMRTSGGRVGKEEGELEKEAELAKERELALHDSGRHLDRLGWAELGLGGLEGLVGGRAWELARAIADGRPRKEELETMLCMRLGTLALLAVTSWPASHPQPLQTLLCTDRQCCHEQALQARHVGSEGGICNKSWTSVMSGIIIELMASLCWLMN